MSKLTKKDIKAIEDLGWSVEIYNDGSYCLENYSSFGGDMIIEAENREEIIQSCKNYDAEDEFNVWYGAHNGEPSNPKHLWDDCLDKGEKYQQLKDVLTK